MCPEEKTLLVVDDDTAIRESLKDLLTDEGYCVVTAAHGQEALTTLRNGVRPCLILLDLMMPVMSGPEFYQEQQADPTLASIPVVIISADGNVQKKAQPFGGKYLSKPVKIDIVLDTIERYCA